MSVRLSLPQGQYVYKDVRFEHSYYGFWSVMTKDFHKEKDRTKQVELDLLSEFVRLPNEERRKYLV